MKGLLLKDFCYYVRNRTMLFVLIPVIVFAMSSRLFGAIYLSIICATLVQSTFSYDEFERGMEYILTLPITRKTYVTSKYVLGVGLFAFFIAVYSAAVLVSGGSGHDLLGLVPASAAAFSVSVSGVFPILFKLGSEKGRVVSILGIMIAAMAAGAFLSILPQESLSGAVTPAAAAAIAAALVLIMFLSYLLSLAIVKNKEY